MIDIIVSLIPIVFVSGLVMSGIKYLAIVKDSVLWLRCALFVVSFLGVLANATLTGSALDLNQLTDIFRGLMEAVGVAVAAHFTYRINKNV